MSDAMLKTAMTASVIRSLVICTLVCLLLPLFSHWIQRGQTRHARTLRQLCCVLPFFTPDLVTGFQYRLTASAWAGLSGGLSYVVLTELLYGTLQFFRAAALGLLLYRILPSASVTTESIHSWRLLRTQIPTVRWYREWLRLQLAGPWRTTLLIWSLTAVVVFQEFETAALMQIDQHPWSWAVGLFDAHAAWQPLSQSLKMAAAALLIEMLLLIPGLLAVACSLTSSAAPAEPCPVRLTGSRIQSGAAWPLVGLSLGLLILIPIYSSAPAALRGIEDLLSDSVAVRRTASSLATSICCAAAAAICALGIASRLSPDLRGRQRILAVISGCLLLPGLAGPLILSLGLQTLFQLPLLRPAWDTMLPQLLGQILWLLPRAFAAAQLLWTEERSESLHAASLLLQAADSQQRRTAAGLIWRLQDLPLTVALLVLTHWAFWDVTTASLLHPVTFEPIVTRLYNEMHFARTEALLGLTALSISTPAVCLTVVGTVAFVFRLFRRQ